MEQKRLLLFVTLSATVLFFWQLFVMPVIAPPKPVPQQVAQEAEAKDDDAPLVAKKPDEPKDAEIKPVEQPQVKQADLLKNPSKKIVLGSLDPESGYFMQASISTQGAAVIDAFLNDPLYRDLNNQKDPLKVLDEFDGGGKAKIRSLEVEIEQLDQKLAPLLTDTRRVNWKVLEQIKDPDNPKIIQSVRLGLTAPDGSIEVQKEFGLKKYPVPEDQDFREFRNKEQAGYLIHFDIKVINKSTEQQKLDYHLLGPVGIPLENADNTRKFRDVRIGFLQDDLSVDTETFYAADIIEAVQAKNVEKYTRAFQFAGVDVQYFAALLTPDGKNYEPKLVNGEMRSNYSASIEPVLIQQDLKNESQSRTTIQINSNEIELDAGGEIDHGYALYAGPKRESLLGPPLKATEIMDFGFFGPVAKLMLWLLNTLHGIGLSYGLAIIGLTIMVRGSLYPLSRKQAVGAQKMKELQPQIAEIKKKYGDDREKLGRAQMELFSKNNYNPLAGCLPIFLQLPIFFGLYTALNNAVQLRGTPFLWVDNLAAPDALFKLPFSLPFLGDNFNLLPLVTVGLFVVQQKLFMPPPTDKDQELQHKIMNYMMIAMGFMFYRVPAGLCVYFIASSLWGICERKLLDFQSKRAPKVSETTDSKTIEIKAESKKTKNKKETSESQEPAKKGWFARLQDIADQAQAQAALNEKKQQNGRGGKGTGKKPKKRR
ncbi:YidC/Oxa1 family insertase periplasmic-domain containing protein [Gimesia fumaroli]|jgi:YidC/Oxa1 family membrane protein insertase|uniref:Membrane protein insertase YidC n=1 Tax=Gimesia fumaroli TaxID=2527976 RepID=A0A518ICJ0_9PLAN|nr:YidC/Oxa1 family insertase periplasmic-domain containing protein [Gimesia fumaroli]QDV50807.1 Membrane protein insertase YidC [Gimesia fumaroli]